MADEPFVHNIIRFKGVPLKLDGAFAWKCGVEPDVNSFVCAWEDFEQRLLKTASVPGDLEFFYLRDRVAGDANAPADLTFKGMRLVSWSPKDMGSTAGTPPRIGVVTYCIRLADARERFVKPRGGRLIVPEVLNAKGDPKQLTNGELIEQCLAAMGELTAPPDGVNAVPAPKDLKWFGSHAPEELEKLLDRVGAVAFPLRGGGLRTDMIGEGATFDAPKGRELPTVQLEGQDRRGRTVVFTSYPNANLERARIDGPHDDSWQYVAPDPEDFGYWKKLADIPLLKPDPLKAFRDRFKNAPEQHREFLDRYVYRCVRLNRDKYGKAPLLRVSPRQRTSETGGAGVKGVVEDTSIEVYAKRYLQTVDGTGRWMTPSTKVLINAASIAYGAILKFDRPLMKLDTPNPIQPDILQFLTPLVDGDMTITFSREERDAKTSLLKYFQAGYRVGPDGKPLELGERETAAILANPGADDIVIEEPGWVLYKQNNEYVNLVDLKKAAKARAAQLLKGSTQPAELRAAVGFFPIELSGRVAEIRITQEPPRTEWKVNTWWLPQEYYLGRLRAKQKAASAGNAFPSQQATQAERQALGAGGEVQPEVILDPTPQELPAAAGGALIVKPTKKLDGGWYEGVVYVGRPVAVFKAGTPLGELAGTTEPCLVANGMEQDRRTNRVVLNRLYVAVELEPQAKPDGRRTLLIQHDPDTVKDLRHDAAKHWVQVSFTSDGADGWHDKIETEPCGEGGGS